MNERSLPVLLLVSCLLAGGVRAQDADQVKQAAGAAATGEMGRLAGDLNFGQIDGDLFMTVNLDFSIDLGQVGFGIRVPLRLRLTDEDPQNEEYGGVLRREDWDEWSDYLKIIRYFRYGHKGDLLHLVVGELWGATLGHGTIVNRYYNNLDLDHFKVGLQLDVDTDYGGVETVINHLFQPSLFGGRAYLKPWSFIDTESYLNNLAVGLTTVSDVTAPYAVAAGQVEDGYPQVTEEKATTIMGGDIEFRVLDSSWLTLTPYMDLNGIIGAGIGYHAGILGVFHLPVISLDLTARIEYRYLNPDYIPAYFDPYYEIQKFSYPYKDHQAGLELEAPKRAVLERLGDKNLNGYWAELIFQVNNWFTLGASYDDYDGPYNSNLRIFLDVPALEVIQFGAYYYKHNFEGAGEAFTFDDKSLFLVEARYQMFSFLYLVGQYWRIWQLDTDPQSPDYGQYVSVDDWSLGIGAAYSF
ncbi:MAG: hypothetical protein DRI34_08710 [Deltaproteobacteria bacterium]|nr:MAG: hypothetical protein DRI34_08710 [Deltaproteobacteria bacterium]